MNKFAISKRVNIWHINNLQRLFNREILYSYFIKCLHKSHFNDNNIIIMTRIQTDIAFQQIQKKKMHTTVRLYKPDMHIDMLRTVFCVVYL